MPSPEIEEEQQMEMEALNALFTHQDEFTQLSSNSCFLRLLPYGELGDKDPKNLVSAHLFFEFTENYPHEMPVWRIETTRGLGLGDVQELTARLEKDMRNNIGTAMVFSAAEVAVDFLRDHNKPPQSMHDRMMNRERLEAGEANASSDDGEASGDENDFEKRDLSDDSEDDATQYRGLAEKNLCSASERCTKEQFEAWAVNFRKEMEEKGIWISRSRRDVITGRLLFERDAAGAAAAADNESSGNTWIDDSLFLNGDVPSDDE